MAHGKEGLSTIQHGVWKAASGSLSEVVEQLDADSVTKSQLIDAGKHGNHFFVMYYEG